uniref:Carbonic anhydrase n=1 Tax=Graphocephala atropunctata TaxID=36148 RepID=A0A1B6KV51_9HEMI
MTLNEDQCKDVEQSKITIKEVARKDGKLKSPIDLVIGVMKPLYLDRIKWMSFENAPRAMKVTNSGETVVITAKWEKEIPYLANGPLCGNYVFSQAHFHWGAYEGEGSEHTVNGVSYPMEMHVLFFKSQYLTQEAAIKEDDGIVIIAYLMKVVDESTLGLKWLSAQLDRVLEPQTSAFMPPFPLSSLLAPTTQDYTLYWGSLAIGDCSHTIQWLISRSALGICKEDLNKFRRILNFQKESMVDNFRTSSQDFGQTVFHVNPSVETEHFLLPGTFCFPGQPQKLCDIIRANNPADKNERTIEKSERSEERKLLESKYLIPTQPLQQILKECSDEWNTSPESYSVKTNDSNSLIAQHKNKVSNHSKKQCQSRSIRIKKLTYEKERRQELEKNRLKMIREIEGSTGQKVYKLGIKSIGLNNKNLLTEKVRENGLTQQIKSGDVQKIIVETEIENEKIYREFEDVILDREIFQEHDVVRTLNVTKASTEQLIKNNDDSDFHPIVAWSTEKASEGVNKDNIGKEKPVAKSKLPRPIQHKKPVIQSSLVKYFTNEYKKQQPELETLHLNVSETKNYKTVNLSPTPKPNQEQGKQPPKKHLQRLQGESLRFCKKPADL